jgi:hypothetical protein
MAISFKRFRILNAETEKPYSADDQGKRCETLDYFLFSVDGLILADGEKGI